MSTAKDQRATKEPRTGAAGSDFDAARARLASLPADFTNRVFDDPAWPADAPEVISPRHTHGT